MAELDAQPLIAFHDRIESITRLCSNRTAQARWSHAAEARGGSRHRLSRLGIDYLAIAVADRSLPPLLMLSVRFLHRRRDHLRVGGVARRLAAARLRPAGVGRRGVVGVAAARRRHGRRRTGRAACPDRPGRAARRERAAVHGAARPHVLRDPAPARRRRRDRRRPARRRAARRPGRADRPASAPPCSSSPPSRGRRARSSRASRRCRGSRSCPRRCRCSAAARCSASPALATGEVVPGPARRDLAGVARRVRVPRRLRLDRRVHRVRLARSATSRSPCSRPTRT